jgi:molybdopterin-guanine dinucleotide biosynthesis protein A
MPDLPDDLARRLQQAVVPGAGVAIAMCAGRLHPVCAVWDTGVQAGLSTYLASGRSSVRGFAEAIGMKDVVWDDAYATAFQNFNTQAELTRVAVGRAIH